LLSDAFVFVQQEILGCSQLDNTVPRSIHSWLRCVQLNYQRAGKTSMHCLLVMRVYL
jgi:hypothetical protein